MRPSTWRPFRWSDLESWLRLSELECSGANFLRQGLVQRSKNSVVLLIVWEIWSWEGEKQQSFFWHGTGNGSGVLEYLVTHVNTLPVRPFPV